MSTLRLLTYSLLSLSIACGAPDTDEPSTTWDLNENETSSITSCPETEDGHHYIGDSPEACETIDFDCDDDQSFFENDCGCGCVDDAISTPDCPDDNRYDYLEDDPDRCELIDFGCAGDQQHFHNECGCGCRSLSQNQPDDCPDEADGYEYVSEDPDECEMIFISCDDGSEGFDNECGCGCVESESTSACAAQDATGTGDACPGEPLFSFDGEACTEIGDDYCYCEGADCDDLTHTREECEQKFAGCLGNCEPMDAVGEGPCDEFFGWAYQGGSDDQEACVGVGGCDCIGDDCGRLYQDLDTCLDVAAQCTE